jgi:hypothetical protein
MTSAAVSNQARWPALDLAGWEETRATFHMHRVGGRMTAMDSVTGLLEDFAA